MIAEETMYLLLYRDKCNLFSYKIMNNQLLIAVLDLDTHKFTRMRHYFEISKKTPPSYVSLTPNWYAYKEEGS